MSERRRDEKEEKEEKGTGRQEQSLDEKGRRDPLGAIVWAAILIWAGLVLLDSNLQLTGLLTEDNAWALGFVGAGVIVLLGVLVRLVIPEYRRPVAGTLILGVVLLGIGLGQLVSWAIIGPLVLFAIAVSIIIRGFLPRR